MLRQIVKDIIRQLRDGMEDGLTADDIEDSINKINNHLPRQYHYNCKKFPALKRTKHLSMGSIVTPQSVAEAYIWKQGKWKEYGKFVGWYYYPDAKPPKDRIVMYAYAKHLRDPSLPIFDQHALRSLWAISDVLWAARLDPCKDYLVVAKTNNWKDSGNSRTSALLCYRLFCAEFIATRAANNISQYRFDQLLWSLGKALKSISKTHTGGRGNDYDEFCDIIGR